MMSDLLAMPSIGQRRSFVAQAFLSRGSNSAKAKSRRNWASNRARPTLRMGNLTSERKTPPNPSHLNATDERIECRACSSTTLRLSCRHHSRHFARLLRRVQGCLGHQRFQLLATVNRLLRLYFREGCHLPSGSAARSRVSISDSAVANEFSHCLVHGSPSARPETFQNNGPGTSRLDAPDRRVLPEHAGQ